MAGFNFAQAKKQSRQALHGTLAVPAVYSDDLTPDTAIRARWHTKINRAGNSQGGYDVEILEGINKLVFQETDLATALRPVPDPDPTVVGTPLTLRQCGRIFFPDYNVTLELDTQAPTDGPENVYWNVVEAP